MEMTPVELLINSYCGYPLVTKKSIWRHSEAEIKRRSNGCGPDGWKSIVIPDTLLGVCFTPACDLHDVEYDEGKTPEDKLIADNNLITNMLTINQKDAFCFLDRWLRRKLILGYYDGVADLGFEFFGK